MYEKHHSMERHQSQQSFARSKWDKLSLACALRGIAITRGFRNITMHTPEGVVSTSQSVADAWDLYHNDIAYHGLPVITKKEEEQE